MVVTFVAAAVEEGGGFCIGTSHDDARHLHDVELQTSSVKTLDLLIYWDQNLASLMSAFLDTRFLVFNMIAGHTHLDKATDQVPHVGIATMACVSIGDDEWPVVDFRSLGTFFFIHAQAQEVLVAVCGQ